MKNPELSDTEKASVIKPNVEQFYSIIDSISSDIFEETDGSYSSNKEVEAVQIALNILDDSKYGLPRYGVDGKYGPETAKAVDNFKKDNGLKVDNITESRIRRFLKESVMSAPLKNMPSRINHGFDEVRQKKGGGTRLHKGVDLGVPSGSDIVAPADGVVVAAVFSDSNCGGTIKIKHGDGIESLYCHCKAIDVTDGETVKKGDIIGQTGGAANDKGKGNSQGAHLHFGLKKNGEWVDPMDYIDKTEILSSPETSGLEPTKKDEKKSKSSITPEMADLLVSKLKEKGLDDDDLEKYTKFKISFDDVVVDKDEDFYNHVLEGIGAPKTSNNMKFLLAWRQAEGGKARNNPFNTTYRLSNDSGMCIYNCISPSGGGKSPIDCNKCPEGTKAGVKHYSTPQYGLEATVLTLKLDFYTCIVNGLREQKDPEEIAKCSCLKTWGTGNGISSVLDSKGPLKPKAIYS